MTLLRLSLFLSFVFVAFGGIAYTTSDINIAAGLYFGIDSGVYALSDTPAGTDQPVVSFNLTLTQQGGDSNQSVTAEIFVLHSSRANEIGSSSENQCCTQLMYDLGLCTNLGRVLLNIVPGSSNNTLVHYEQTLAPNTPIDIHHTIVPELSGIWYIFLFNCDINDNSYSFSGRFVWRSPYGYIPAQSFGNMLVYFIVAVLYFILLVLWTIWLIRYRVDLHRYQHAVTVLIVVSFIEEMLWGFQYIQYNNDGISTLGMLVPSILFSAFKLTGVRLLLLLMALGYAITIPTLPRRLIFIISFVTLCFFVISAIDSYLSISSVFSSTPVPDVVTWLTGVLVVILNIIFIAWIVAASMRSMKGCQNDKSEKYAMYLRLMIIFGIICIISVIFYFVQFAINVVDTLMISFRVWWLLNTYWEFIYLVITCYIAFVWRPADDNARYAYQILEGDDNVDMSNIPPPVSEPKDEEDSSSSSE